MRDVNTFTTNVPQYVLHFAKKSLRFLLPEPSPDKHLGGDLCHLRAEWCSSSHPDVVCIDVAIWPRLFLQVLQDHSTLGVWVANSQRVRTGDRTKRHPVELCCDGTDWGGWSCIGLWSCVLEHPAPPRWQSSEGSSAEEMRQHGNSRHEKAHRANKSRGDEEAARQRCVAACYLILSVERLCVSRSLLQHGVGQRSGGGVQQLKPHLLGGGDGAHAFHPQGVDVQ